MQGPNIQVSISPPANNAQVPIYKKYLLKYYLNFTEIANLLSSSNEGSLAGELRFILRRIRERLVSIKALELGEKVFNNNNLDFVTRDERNYYLSKEEISDYYKQTMDILKNDIEVILQKAKNRKAELKRSSITITTKRVALYDKFISLANEFISLANDLLRGKPYVPNQGGAARRRRKASRRYNKTGGKKRGSRRTRRSR
jgi:hypothetical protein